MTKAATDPVADHRVTHRFRHDEAGARRGGLRRLIEEKMDDNRAAARPAAAANRCGEVSATPQSLRRGQHVYLGIPGPDQRRLRPTACRDPWSGGRRGWPDRPGCACAAGNRGSSRAGGCSAGRCACSRVNSVFVRHLWGIGLQDATLAECGGATARGYAGPVRWSTIPRVGTPTSRPVPPGRWSFYASSESFPARRHPPGSASVEAAVAALLACPFAGLRRRSHIGADQPKPDKAVNRSAR
jgi:hypothetical protein